VLVGSLSFITEAIIYILICAYFYAVSKNWVYLQLPGLAMSIIGTIYIFFLPESPRYLISRQKFDEARTAFRRIAT